MISNQFIDSLATKHQSLEANILREYCQHLFLSYLYRRQESGRLYFKGGTALRIVYSSPRFSEDLDFSASDISVESINKLIDEVLASIEKEGITAKKEVNPGTQGETSGGYFAVITFNLLDSVVQIKIQVSFRQSSTLKSNTTLVGSDFVPAYTMVCLAQDLLVGEKVQALLEREKPRDFFDLYFILRHPELARFIPKTADIKPKLIGKTNMSLENGWEKELKIFLPVSFHPLLKNFKDRLIGEIENHL